MCFDGCRELKVCMDDTQECPGSAVHATPMQRVEDVGLHPGDCVCLCHNPFAQ